MVVSAQELKKQRVSLRMHWGNVRLATFVLTCSFLITGCGSEAQTTPSDSKNENETSEIELPTSDKPIPMTPNELRKKLKANQYAQFQQKDGEFTGAILANSGVRDISALKGLPLEVLEASKLKIDDISALEGMPLKGLYLTETNVSDLSSLKGMQLEELYLDRTPVADITPLSEVQVKQLNMVGSQVADISPLAEMKLEILWVGSTPVTDISPLKGNSMVSLDIENTKVNDLSPLVENTGLQRLNIVGTEVTDLTPLAKLQLTRLLFDPAKIEKGLDVIRAMSSLTELGTSFDGRMPPAQFWEQYDAEQAAKSTSTKNSEKENDDEKESSEGKDAKEKTVEE